MPTCDPSVIPVVIGRVMKLRPRSILDVGAGMGKWGLLFREYLEGWHHHRYKRDRWQVKIDGIEIFGDYIQDWHRAIYDSIVPGDVRRVFTGDLMGLHYDLIFMGDVIEHMPKQDGWKLLKELPYRTCIISTPNFPTRVHRNPENVHQDHLSRWSAEDFRTLKHVILLKGRMLVVEVTKA
jgi:2-polyprenyl-3-methyl-5-hydroxy-6-metoxy-1,4-benzoquinol methylase